MVKWSTKANVASPLWTYESFSKTPPLSTTTELVKQKPLGWSHEKCVIQIQRKSLISPHNNTCKIYNTQVWHRTRRPVKVSASDYWMCVFLVKLSIPILGSVLRYAQLSCALQFKRKERVKATVLCKRQARMLWTKCIKDVQKYTTFTKYITLPRHWFVSQR